VSDQREEYRLIMELLAPLAALKQDIESATALRPTAMMLPLSAFPGLEAYLGLPVIRGDRAALLFEPVISHS
jgi:hypothetical protein